MQAERGEKKRLDRGEQPDRFALFFTSRQITTRFEWRTSVCL